MSAASVLGPTGGCSIAIFKTDPAGTFSIHSQGNNLQLFTAFLLPPPFDLPVELFLEANNAPNVSDVVFLNSGEMIQIHAWWDGGLGAGAVADLAIAGHKTYVSVHKLS